MTKPAAIDDAHLRNLLAKLFTAHGVDAVEAEDGWVRLPGHPHARAMARVVGERRHPNAVVVQLDVAVFVGFGLMVLESFAGVGATHLDAVRNALEGFTSGTFHVLLAAFFGRDDERVDHEEWTVGGVARRVTAGSALTRGTGWPHPATHDRAWWEALCAAVGEAGLPEGTHWVRFYCARNGSEPPTVEVLLDNEEWPAVQSAMARRDRPVAAGFASLRVFLIIQGGMEMSPLVEALCEGSGEDLDRLVARGGLERPQAELAAAFIPLAFGRALLANLPIRFGDEVIAVAVDGSHQTLVLGDQPLFLQASSFARHVMRFGTLSREQITALAFRSPEARAVNDALLAGSRPEDLVTGPPMLLLAEHDDGGPAPEPAPPPSEPPPPPAPARRWWPFRR